MMYVVINFHNQIVYENIKNLIHFSFWNPLRNQIYEYKNTIYYSLNKLGDKYLSM